MMMISKIMRYLWYEFAPLNISRSLFWWFAIKFLPRRWPTKLHLGCGNERLDGYLNIDRTKSPATDIVYDIRKLPFRQGLFDAIESHHVIEHLGQNDFKATLLSWRALLREGGRMIIECPDFDQDLRDYLAGKSERLDSIFGLQRYPGDAHLFGYNFERLKSLLENCGYKDIVRLEARDYHIEFEPCLRVECHK